MRTYQPKWHASHVFNDDEVARQILEVINVGKNEVIRVTIHKEPCALCAAAICEIIWDGDWGQISDRLELEMAKVSDGPTSTPSET